MAVLKWTIMLRVVANERIDLTLKAISVQWIDLDLMAMLQRTTMLRLSLGHKRLQVQSPKVLALAGRRP